MLRGPDRKPAAHLFEPVPRDGKWSENSLDEWAVSVRETLCFQLGEGVVNKLKTIETFTEREDTEYSLIFRKDTNPELPQRSVETGIMQSTEALKIATRHKR